MYTPEDAGNNLDIGFADVSSYRMNLIPTKNFN
jgi:hypothetical protein